MKEDIDALALFLLLPLLLPVVAGSREKVLLNDSLLMLLLTADGG